MFQCTEGMVAGFRWIQTIAYADRQGEGGGFSNVSQQWQTLEMIGAVFYILSSCKKKIIGRRLFNAGSIDMMGGSVNFLCDGQLFYRKPVCIIIWQVIIGAVDMNGNDSGLAVLGEMEFMGQDQPLDSVANIIKGRLKNINGNAFGMKDFSDFVIHGDAEIDFTLTVELFHFIGGLNEKAFAVGGQVDNFQGCFFW